MASIRAKMASPIKLGVLLASILAGSTISGCSKAKETPSEHLSRANEYFNAQQYDKAEQEYKAVLRLSPGDLVALRRLGIIYFDQGELPQAYPMLKQASELQADDPEVQLKLGQTYRVMGEFQQARDIAQEVLEKQPGNEKALLLLVDSANSPAEAEAARTLIKSLRERDEDRAVYHLALGAIDLRQQDQSSAETQFRTALEMDPKLATVHTALGSLYWSRNDLKAADEAFKAASDLSPPRSPAHLRYADFKLRTGAIADAKAMLEEMTRKYTDYLPARVLLMKVACSERRDDDCATRVQNILAQDSVNFDAVLQDGLISLFKGDSAKAIRDFEFLSDAFSRNAQVRYQLSLAYLQFAKNASPVDSRNAIESAENRLSEAIKLDPHLEQAVLLFAELKIRKGAGAAAIDPLVQLTKDRPQSAQAHYLLATAYLSQQRTDQALAVYRQMTQLFPQDPQPSFLIGTILLSQRQQAEAREAFEKSAAISPDYLPAVEKLVDFDLAGQQYETAISRVQPQIDKDPKRAPAWALRGKIYFVQRDFAHAESDLLKAIELDPKLEPAYTLLAQLYVATNRQEEAVQKLNAFVEQNKTVPTLMQLAAIHQQLKQFDQARDDYEKLLTVNPNFTPALNNLAVIYSERLGEMDKAYDLAKKAREAAPNEPHLADTFGWITFKKGDYNNAITLLKESATKLPDDPEIQFHAGMAYYMLGQEEPARLALQKAVDASADFSGKAEARKRLAVLAIDPATANVGAAKLELENYLREQPNDPAALMRVAELQERDGASDQAIKTYEKVAADNPSFAPAIRHLALLYSRRPGDDPKVYDLAQKARQAYPEDPEVAKLLGIASYRREYYPRAVELLQEAGAKGKDDPEVLYYLGESQYQLKHWNECKSALDRALTLNLSRELVDEAQRVTAECTENLAQ